MFGLESLSLLFHSFRFLSFKYTQMVRIENLESDEVKVKLKFFSCLQMFEQIICIKSSQA